MFEVKKKRNCTKTYTYSIATVFTVIYSNDNYEWNIRPFKLNIEIKSGYYSIGGINSGRKHKLLA